LCFSSLLRIHDWELENEVTLADGVKKGNRDVPGHVASVYETPKAHQWAAVMRGMSRAIRDVQSKTGQPLRIVVDVPGPDFGWIPFLEQNGVFIDKVAHHYYYNLETSPYKISAPNYNGHFDIFAELKKLGKPVIINEFNAAEIYDPKNLHKPYNDAKALRSVKKHIEYILAQKDASIEGVEFYDLYDDKVDDPAESNFGLMHDATHMKKQILVAAVYACGTLSAEEQRALVSDGLFTQAALADRVRGCARKRELRTSARGE
jgi:hypothetical protein